MTHTSKKILTKKVEEQLTAQLAKLFSGKKEGPITELFSDLLTAAEQIMLVKRLAIIFMLTEGYSTYRIAKMLLVSDSTVRDIQAKLHVGHYQHLIQSSSGKTFNSKEFLNILEVILSGGLPSRGKNRWKGVR